MTINEEQAFTFTDTFTLPIDVDAVGARGDAHVFGRDLTMTAVLPNRSTRGLLRRAGQLDNKRRWGNGPPASARPAPRASAPAPD
jgi:hypothetical protein